MAISILSLLSPTILFAAETTQPIDATVEEIVVTARKTSERLQDVPMSINAVTGEQLRERSAVDIKDVLRSVPGLSFSGTERGLSNYNIRGVSTIASSPTVGIYLDDISLVTVATFFSGAFDLIFFDIDRLEVLKGPQGTLYGGSSMGGAIKYVSVKPDLTEFSGSTTAGLATTEHGSESYNAEAIFNAPLIPDQLALRAGFHYRHEGGYVDNEPDLMVQNSSVSSEPYPSYVPQTFNSLSTRHNPDQNQANTYVGRVSLLWQPDPSWSIQPTALYQDTQLDNSAQSFLQEPLFTASWRLPQPTHDRAGIYSLDVEKEFSSTQFTSLTSYFDRKLDYERDYSFELGYLVPELLPLDSRNVSISDTTTFAQEVRLASNTSADAPFRWIAGLYYSDQDDRLIQTVTTPGATPILGTELGYFGDTSTRTRQYAAFGEATYRLFGSLDLTAGVRLFEIKQTIDLLGDGPFNGGLTQVTGRRSKEDGVNPKVGLSYKLDDDKLIYASAAKGFRPGGPNRFLISADLCGEDLARLGLSAAPDSFTSDNLWSYELGSKNQFGDGRLLVNGSVFYTDWKKIQQQIVLNSCGGFSFTANAGVAEVKGVELESRFNLTRDFQVGGTATYTDAKIVTPAAGTDIQPGDAIQSVPIWMTSAFLSYGLQVNAAWHMQMRAEYQYQGKASNGSDRTMTVTFADGLRRPVPNPAEDRASYEVSNAYASFGNGATDIRLYVNNLFDTRPYLGLGLGGGSDEYTTLRPRTIGVEVKQRF